MSFFCPRCDNKTTVLSTRLEVRERRCLSCRFTFRTEEIEYSGPMPWTRKERRCQPHQPTNQSQK